MAAAMAFPLVASPTGTRHLESFGASGRRKRDGVSYVAGEVTVTFTSEIGRTYSVYGSQDLSDPASWPEISVGDINGDGNDLDFAHIPGVTPYFLQVRED